MQQNILNMNVLAKIQTFFHTLNKGINAI